MKCLTVQQPWATLTVTGATRYLVRDWRTYHRGVLAIQAARFMPRSHVELCCEPDMRAVLERCRYAYASELPRQAVLGTVTVVDCLLVSEVNRHLFAADDPAVVFGLLQVGRWAWICTAPCPAPRPVPLGGRLGLFSIPDSVFLG